MIIKPIYMVKPMVGASISPSLCEAVARTDIQNDRSRHWRQQRYKDRNPMLCRYNARYVVDGKKMCARHAGMAILEHINQNEVTEI